MRRLLAVCLVILVLGACARRGELAASSEISPAAGAGSVSYATMRTYTSSDGVFSFRFPATWFVEDHWREMSTSFLTNFELGVRCCDMQPGDLKVDYRAEPRNGRSFDDVLAQMCVSGENRRVTRCTTVDVDGTRWGWVRADDDAEGSTVDLQAFAIRGDQVYIAVAFVPEGPAQPEGISQTERIYRTFRLR